MIGDCLSYIRMFMIKEIGGLCVKLCSFALLRFIRLTHESLFVGRNLNSFALLMNDSLKDIFKFIRFAHVHSFHS